MKDKNITNCKGHKGRVEESTCQLCGTNHTMTFEFYKKHVEEAIDKVIKLCPDSYADGGRTRESAYADGWAVALCVLLKELGLDVKLLKELGLEVKNDI